MGSNKEQQAARNAADRRLREAHPTEHEMFMEEEHALRGLTWKRRLPAEERAARKEEEARAKVAEKIRAMAEANGLDVQILPAGVAQQIEATLNGTAETVTVQWRGDESGLRTETTEERALRISAEAEAAEAVVTE